MKKKILFVNGHLNVGGVEKSLVDILRHMDYDRFEVDLLLLEETGDYCAQIPPQVHIILKSLYNTYGPLFPCLWRCFKKGDWFSLKMRIVLLVAKLFGQKWLRLSRRMLMGNRKYDCAVGFRSGICTQVVAFASDAPRKITWWHHGEFNVPAGEYKEAAMACDVVAVVSESCAEMLRQEIPDLQTLLRVIPNMVDKNELQQKVCEAVPYTEKYPHLVTVCRLASEKHVENVLYAASWMKQQGLNFLWHIVGDGVLRADLESQAAAMDVLDCVRFEGSQTNPYPYMKNAFLYVHPSYVESQGLTILEAMALGVPCVVTNSRGPSEFVQDGVNGILVQPSPQALADGVCRMMCQKELYNAVKQNTYVPQQFQPIPVMQKVENVLNGVTM